MTGAVQGRASPAEASREVSTRAYQAVVAATRASFVEAALLAPREGAAVAARAPVDEAAPRRAEQTREAEAPALVVLAAGMGSRYGGLKQIDPVGPSGETLLDYSIFDAVRAGFEKVVFVIRRDIEDDFVDRVGARYEELDGLTVGYAFQELDDLPRGFDLPENREKPWGTGHATLAARQHLGGPFAVVNADDFYGRRAYAMLGEHLRSGHDDYAMVGFVLRETLSEHGTVTRGVCRTSGGFLEQIVELSEIARQQQGATYPGDGDEPGRLTGTETVSMNLWGFTPSIFPHLEAGLVEFLESRIGDPVSEFLLPDLIDRLIAEGAARVRVLEGGGPWFGVTYREDREGVARSIREQIDAGEYPEKLWG
jgi:NDP-sugar pyrophosphorylase family protein